jgi:hypothetical protein
MSESNSHQTINAITKLLYSIISKEYPQIQKYLVTSDCYDNECVYNIVVFMKYEDALAINLEALRKKIRGVGKYVISPPDGIYQIVFSEP